MLTFKIILIKKICIKQLIALMSPNRYFHLFKILVILNNNNFTHLIKDNSVLITKETVLMSMISNNKKPFTITITIRKFNINNSNSNSNKINKRLHNKFMMNKKWYQICRLNFRIIINLLKETIK